MRNQQGFTLIELMIVIAILGILLAIAIPAYQDYTVRTYVSEGLNLAASPKLGVSEFVQTNDAFPGTNAEAGYDGVTTEIVTSITIGAGGVITVLYNSPPPINGSKLILTPQTVTGGAVEWSCEDNKSFGSTGTIASRYKPASCRPN